MESFKLEKKNLLRNNEYYLTQPIFDKLFSDSRKNKKFKNLMPYITDRNNILLAYRNMKRNKGSVTPGVDGKGIEFIKGMGIEKYIHYIQNKFKNYKPKQVKRVMIPKEGGKERPLGIPCIDDRIIQQCIKQILEPICEAKFHKHSYGFRPNRSVDNALARCNFLMWRAKTHYVVDIDIKGFFDNVNHAKLKKQMWHLGIQDKNLISVIGKILTSEIKGEGIPTKGTPQGGIISPLLSNIVLNELDWWISSQWETKTTRKEYKGCKSSTLKRISNLKEIWLVRYADDFKIFCKDSKTAIKIYNATRMWLKERLGLDISPEKSKITNLRKNYTEFLGFRLKVREKCKQWYVKSKMSDKAKKHISEKFRRQIKWIKDNTDPYRVSVLNSMITGWHNYYSMATNASKDFAKLNFILNRTLDIRLRHQITNKANKSKYHIKRYGKYNGKIRTICSITIFPLYGCEYRIPRGFNQDTCNYTEIGRKLVHTKLQSKSYLVEYLIKNQNKNNSVEYNDNRIALMLGQNGKCFVTGDKLSPGDMECHHKQMKITGGTDDYKNLVWLKKDIHILVHAIKDETINIYKNILNLDEKGYKRINNLRKLVGNSMI